MIDWLLGYSEKDQLMQKRSLFQSLLSFRTAIRFWCQRDTNSDRWSRRRVRWPLRPSHPMAKGTQKCLPKGMAVHCTVHAWYLFLTTNVAYECWCPVFSLLHTMTMTIGTKEFKEYQWDAGTRTEDNQEPIWSTNFSITMLHWNKALW